MGLGKINPGFNLSKQNEETNHQGTCSPKKSKEVITIVGTGEFGESLGMNLMRVGHKVHFVSRNPEKARSRCVNDHLKILDINEASQYDGIIILAIPENVDTLSMQQLFLNRIVLDVRNRLKRKSNKSSLGETLQINHPDSMIVKSLNNFSAYSLRSGIHQSGKQTFICGNCINAKSEVSTLLQSLGMSPVDRGDINQSQYLEDIPHSFFEEWIFPMMLTTALICFFWIFLVFRKVLCPNFDADEWDFSKFKKIILDIAQLTFGLASFTLLALCYTPGVIAAYLQLYRGTKHSLFPSWLDRWLRGRKQIGLIAAQIALTHLIGAAVHVLPNMSSDWTHDAYFSAGIFAFGLMLILAVSSLPSVSSSLSWREFSFLQRWGGWMSLVFATLHVIFKGWYGLLENEFMCIFLPSQVQIVLVLPLLTILFKLPLLLPPVDKKLNSIRQGRNSKKNSSTYGNIA